MWQHIFQYLDDFILMCKSRPEECFHTLSTTSDIFLTLVLLVETDKCIADTTIFALTCLVYLLLT